MSVARLAVGAVAVAVESNLRIGEKLPVAHNRYDGKRVLVAGLNVAASDGPAGQESVLIEAEGVVCGFADGEPSVVTLLRVVGIGVVARVKLPRDIVEIEVVFLAVAVQVEGNGLHVLHRLLAPPATLLAHLLVGDGALVDDFLPLRRDVVAAVEDAPIDIVVRRGVGLGRDVGFLVGPHLHAEAVLLARAPDVVGRVDEELGIVVVLRVGDGMHADAPAAARAHAVDDALHVAAAIGIAADEAAGIAALTVAVPDIFFPETGPLAVCLRCRGQAAVGGVHQRGTLWDVDAELERAREQLAVCADDGLRQALRGEGGGGIAGAWRGCGRPSPLVAAIGGAGVGGAAQRFRIACAGDERSTLVAQANHAPVAIQLERRLIAFDVVGPHPHHQEPLGRNRADVVGHLPAGQV